MRTRPKLLDLFCGAGGCSQGYARAGFHVTGVDNEFQSRHPGAPTLFTPDEFRFVQADALEYVAAHGREYDAIHASPPCQAFCSLRFMPNARPHINLIPETRAALLAAGRPFVIENVPGAPLIEPVMLCGTMFDLRTDCGAELRRHRMFETNWHLKCDKKCSHGDRKRRRSLGQHAAKDGKVITIVGHTAEFRGGRTICVNGTGLPLSGGKVITVVGDHPRDEAARYARRRTISITGSTPQRATRQYDGRTVTLLRRECFPVSAARTAMGIDWMIMAELSQAIPPAYTEWIGRQLLRSCF